MWTFFLLHHVFLVFNLPLTFRKFLTLDSIRILIFHSPSIKLISLGKIPSNWIVVMGDGCGVASGKLEFEFELVNILIVDSTWQQYSAHQNAALELSGVHKNFTFFCLFYFMASSTSFFIFYFHVSRNEIVLHLMNFYVALLLSKFIATRLSLPFFSFQCFNFIAQPTDPFRCGELFSISSIHRKTVWLDFHSFRVLFVYSSQAPATQNIFRGSSFSQSWRNVNFQPWGNF